MEDTPAAIRKLEAEKAVLLAQLYRTRHGMDVAEASRTLKDYVISKIANKEEPLRSTFRDANGQPNLWKQVGKRRAAAAGAADKGATAAGARGQQQRRGRCAVV